MKKIFKSPSFFLLTLVIFLSFVLAYFVFKPDVSQTEADANQTRVSTSGELDSDYDGLSDQTEINIYHTNPYKADTDGDGYLDSAEVLIGSNPLNSRDPLAYLNGGQINAPTTVKPSVSNLPWYATRASGIVGYFLMFFIVLVGTGMTTSYIYRFVNPVRAWLIHKYLSLTLGVAVLTHIFALSLDKFVNFSWAEILLPFYSSFKPLYMGLGILAFYILIIIIFTSLFIRLKYKRTWRGIHYAVYALFLASLIHGLFIGTDSNSFFMKTSYQVSGLIFMALLIYRFVLYLIKERSHRRPVNLSL